MLQVEDNQLNAEIAAELLRMSGLTVDCAWDGIEAVDCLSSCPDGYYDMVFMDIQMPRMNGYDATRAIRSSARDYCKRVPIVAMTANAFAEDVQAAKTVGMNEHIAKLLELTAVRAIRKDTAELAEGVWMPFPESSLHSIRLFLTRMDVLFQWFRLCGRDKGGFPIVTLTPSASSSLPHISKA